jgi:hypothetical protein
VQTRNDGMLLGSLAMHRPRVHMGGATLAGHVTSLVVLVRYEDRATSLSLVLVTRPPVPTTPRAQRQRDDT